MKKGIILLGSSNSHGETRLAADFVSDKTGFPIVDLRTKKIAEFDYEFKNQGDDFLPLMLKIVDEYDLILFATPVYWYTMSGIMKTFFDRISDCLKIDKETGRKLRGKHMAVISCGTDRDLKEGFHKPFKESAKYLGMQYISDVHCWVEEGVLPTEIEEKLEAFVQNIT